MQDRPSDAGSFRNTFGQQAYSCTTSDFEISFPNLLRRCLLLGWIMSTHWFLLAL
jgi:hypothetical protein